MDTREFLELLSNGNGVSGFEFKLNEIVKDAFSKHTDSVAVDKLGNIIAHKKGTGNGAVKILVAAHMDEIGFMVKDIDEKGFVHFTNIGGIDPRTILAQEVVIHGREEIQGVIGSKPPHLQSESEQKKSIKMEDMIIDTGYKEDRIKNLIEIGDSITVNRKMKSLLNSRVYGKAMDDRAGVASLYEAMKEMSRINHYADIYFVATIQEEVTMAGALTATYGINPDIGIAVDVGFGTTPELNSSNSIEMGKGPGITLGGNIHPGLRKRLVEVAGEYSIPVQTNVWPGPTGTDARAMQITRDGIPALVLSIPLRYMHTSVEVLDMKDVSYTSKLIAFFGTSIIENELEGLLCF
ncbi:MAG: M42 family metallopeptidase [Bacillota bacterium]